MNFRKLALRLWLLTAAAASSARLPEISEADWPGFGAAEAVYGREALASWYGVAYDAQSKCVGDATLTGRQIFLPELDANGTVAVPRRAPDVACYARTKWRKTFDKKGSGRRRRRGKKNGGKSR